MTCKTCSANMQEQQEKERERERTLVREAIINSYLFLRLLARPDLAESGTYCDGVFLIATRDIEIQR